MADLIKKRFRFKFPTVEPSSISGFLDLPNSKVKILDTETKEITERLIDDEMSTYLLKVANEPDIALYRIREHVRRKHGALVERLKKLSKNNGKLELQLDLIDYALSNTEHLLGAENHLNNLKDSCNKILNMKLSHEFEGEDDMDDIEKSPIEGILLNLDVDTEENLRSNPSDPQIGLGKNITKRGSVKSDEIRGLYKQNVEIESFLSDLLTEESSPSDITSHKGTDVGSNQEFGAKVGSGDKFPDAEKMGILDEVVEAMQREVLESEDFVEVSIETSKDSGTETNES